MSFLLDALVLGVLYGIGPCTLFCAPVIVPLVISFSDGGRDGIKQTLIFSAGRIISYASLGAVSGFIGVALEDFVPKEVIALFIIILGILVVLKRYPKKCSFVKAVKGKHASLTSGVMLGLSPCYPLIGLLSLAALSNSPLTGFAMGIVFGIGTTITPLIILGFFAGRWAKFSHEFRDMNTLITGAFLVLLGLATMFL